MRRQSKKKQKSKKNMAVICILSSVFILSLAAVMAVLWRRMPGKVQPSPSPDGLLLDYYGLLAKGKYKEMYGMLDTASKANISSEDFIERNKNIYSGIGACSILAEIIDVEENGQSAAVLYDVQMDTVAGEVSFRNQAIFEVDEEGEGGYALYWDDSLIFPNLTAKDKIRVSEIEAKRGNIYDRNGKLLAGEGIGSSVGLVPSKMQENSKEDIKKLAGILGITPKAIRKKLAAKWVKSDSFVPIKTVDKLTELEQMTDSPGEDTVRKIQRDAALLDIPGVMMTDIKIRQYPLGKAASHLTGYIQQVTAEDLENYPNSGYDANSMMGKSGIESLYEQELKGKSGCEIQIVDSKGKVKSILATAEKQDGEDIYLTIDAGLQEKIFHAYSEDKSCSVAMDPYTGEVLALVSTPSYDANDFIFGMSETLWASLNEDERMPLYNRFRQKLCPGSSFKPIVGAIGLKTGALYPEEDYGNEGRSWQKDKSWGSYFVTTLHACEPANLENALIYSDNIYFAKAALKIGQEEFEQQLRGLGFGESLPFEISLAKSQYSNGENIKSEIQLADSGYGQGEILINPVHLAALYTGFLNHGDAIKPYLRYKEQPLGQVWLESAFLPEHAQAVKDALVQVVESEQGTGHGAYRKKIRLAAKTGTAEIKLSKEDKEGTELGWFCVFTADEGQNKPILLLSMAEDVKGRGGSGYVVTKTNGILDSWFGRK